MFIAEAVAEEGTEENLAVGMIYPPESRILDVSLYASERIATFIFDQVLARIPRRTDVGELIRALAHRPVFAGDAK
jgi:malate dehydrogenase (oxaloacetate-decarboxylating)(NADP+)